MPGELDNSSETSYHFIDSLFFVSCSAEAKNIPIPLDSLAGLDISDYEKKEAEAKAALEAEQASTKPAEGLTTTTTTTTEKTTTTTTVIVNADPSGPAAEVKQGSAEEAETAGQGEDAKDGDNAAGDGVQNGGAESAPPQSVPTNPIDEDGVFLGLRVYTKNECHAQVEGHLRHTES
jgi:hypothetical protein